MVSDRPAGRRPADFTVVLNAYSPLAIAARDPLSLFEYTSVMDPSLG